MALDDPPNSLKSRVDESGSGEEELEKLESDVKQMAQKILEYRATLPDQLKNTFASILSAQRPVFPGFESGSEPGPSGERNPDSGSEGTTQVGEEQKASEKIQLLKGKISSNTTALPTVLKRVKECISKIEELDSYSGIIHPAFKKEKNLADLIYLKLVDFIVAGISKLNRNLKGISSLDHFDLYKGLLHPSRFTWSGNC